MIRIKRIYDSPKPSSGDGKRVLVDRLWPRGLRKDDVVIDEWVKDVAPSTEPAEVVRPRPRPDGRNSKSGTGRSWKRKKECVEALKEDARRGTLTILYSAKDTEHNNATVLKDLIR